MSGQDRKPSSSTLFASFRNRPQSQQKSDKPKKPAKLSRLTKPENMSLEELERRYVGILLERFEGHRARVAGVLGISERNLYRKLRAFHLAENAAGKRRRAGRGGSD